MLLSNTAQSASIRVIPALFARDHAWLDARTLAISVPGGLLRIDVDTGHSLGTLAFGVDPYGVDLSPDGSRLAVADWNRSDSMSQFHLVTVATGAVQTVRFARAETWEQGTYSVVWMDHRTVRLTGEGTGPSPIRLYDTESQSISNLAAVVHGMLLARTPDYGVTVQLTTNQSPGQVQFLSGNTVIADTGSLPIDVFDVAVKPDASSFVLPRPGSSPALVYRRDGAGFQLRGDTAQSDGDARFMRALRYLPTRPFAISADDTSPASSLPGGVTVRNARTLRILDIIDAHDYAPGVVPYRQGRISVSPDEQRVAVTTIDEVRVYDLGDFLFPDDFEAPQ